MSHLRDERVDSGSEGENKEEIFYMFYISLNVNFRKIHPGPARRLARRGQILAAARHGVSGSLGAGHQGQNDSRSTTDFSLIVCQMSLTRKAFSRMRVLYFL